MYWWRCPAGCLINSAVSGLSQGQDSCSLTPYETSGVPIVRPQVCSVCQTSGLLSVWDLRCAEYVRPQVCWVCQTSGVLSMSDVRYAQCVRCQVCWVCQTSGVPQHIWPTLHTGDTNPDFPDPGCSPAKPWLVKQQQKSSDFQYIIYTYMHYISKNNLVFILKALSFNKFNIV